MTRSADSILRLQALAACPPGERGRLESALREVPASRAAGGRRAQREGARLEAYLRSQHDLAMRLGIARVRQVGPPVAHTGPGGRELRVVGLGPADYAGVLAGGRAVAIEAKSRVGRLSQREIPVHQQDDLAAVEALGGLALLVLEQRTPQDPLGTIYAAPWSEIRWSERTIRLPRGGGVRVLAHTIGAEELAGWEVPQRGCYLARWAGGAP